MRRILGERIEEGPPMCCDDIERTGSAEMGRGMPRCRSKVPAPSIPVRLEASCIFSALHEKRCDRGCDNKSLVMRICSAMAELLGALRNQALYSSEVKIEGLAVMRDLKSRSRRALNSGADILPSFSSIMRSPILERIPLGKRTPGRSLGSELNFAISGPPPNTDVPAPEAPRGILPIAGLL
ncbi:hypothetical protein FF38_12770 [Lucilia cuprina]|uniref:Uncharacterized protein n=1 Tax=Lucilia cuprina TaxID=7375 RepID=A0A0L0CH27_LUCCU|nr:hypothetical protein FF38_12770 [Lucilia cuprina]